ncbi:hypothetical protein, partial [Mesorhizobium sp.]|uniref:hypothetical protein n=2 Tax=Mesorhizobium sp. TaxID=1871066 RepID=UPI00257A3324
MNDFLRIRSVSTRVAPSRDTIRHSILSIHPEARRRRQLRDRSSAKLSSAFREPRRLGWLMNTVRSRMWGRIDLCPSGGRLVFQQLPQFPWLERHHRWGSGFILQQLPQFPWLERHHWWGSGFILQQ